jgi:hypothetical protein
MKNCLMVGLMSLGLLGGIAGCTTLERQQTCETARVAYEVYMAVLESGDAPSKEQIMAAKAAAAFLAVYCAVPVPEATPADPATRGSFAPPAVDGYGVLILGKLPPGATRPKGR